MFPINFDMDFLSKSRSQAVLKKLTFIPTNMRSGTRFGGMSHRQRKSTWQSSFSKRWSSRMCRSSIKYLKNQASITMKNVTLSSYVQCHSLWSPGLLPLLLWASRMILVIHVLNGGQYSSSIIGRFGSGDIKLNLMERHKKSRRSFHWQLAGLAT